MPQSNSSSIIAVAGSIFGPGKQPPHHQCSLENKVLAMQRLQDFMADAGTPSSPPNKYGAMSVVTAQQNMATKLANFDDALAPSHPSSLSLATTNTHESTHGSNLISTPISIRNNKRSCQIE